MIVENVPPPKTNAPSVAFERPTPVSDSAADAPAAAGHLVRTKSTSRHEGEEAEAVAVLDRADPCAAFVTFQVGREG